jgi:NAD(P)-dependent dehydrogenase (short-subunit alcohol dehydrogenase family)
MRERRSVAECLHDAFSLEGEVAVVTGGGTGIGFAVGKALTGLGARVAITGRTESVLREATEKLGNRATYLVHDLRQEGTVSVLLEKLAAEVGPITILVNNAGVHLKKAATDTTTDEFKALLDTHVLGAFRFSSAVVPHMVKAGHGSIVFMSSMTALIGMPQVIAYSAAKSAYLGMMRTLACELAPNAIRVNAIVPGWIDTPMLAKAIKNDDERKRRILTRTPLGKFGRPEDIGWAVAFLSSPAAQFITGTVLPIDGGASVGF